MSSDCCLESFQQCKLHVRWRVGWEDVISPWLVGNDHGWQLLERLVCEGDCLFRNTVEDVSLWIAAIGFSAFFNPLDVILGLIDVVRICASRVSTVLPFALEEIFARCKSRAYP